MSSHPTGQIVVRNIRQTQEPRNIRSGHIARSAERAAVQTICAVQTVDAVSLRQRRIRQAHHAFGVGQVTAQTVDRFAVGI